VRKLIVVTVAATCIHPALYAPAAVAVVPPSQAQTMAIGTTYFGNASGLDYWRIPSLLLNDRVQVAWASDDSARDSISEICLTGNVDDYNYEDEYCNLSDDVDDSTGRHKFVASKATSNAFISLWSAFGGPYHLVVERIQHAIGVSITMKDSYTPKSKIKAIASLTNGAPMPQGSVFTLTATVGSTTVTREDAVGKNGRLKFALGLDRTARGQRATLRITRKATSTYIAAKSRPLRVRLS
jgi:hypothetical protein